VSASGAKLDESGLKFIYPNPELIDSIVKNNKLVILTPAGLADSAYCKAMYGNKTVLPYLNSEDLFIKVKMMMAEKNYDFLYVYIEELDKLLHKYLPNSKEADKFVFNLLSSICKHLFKTANEEGCSILIIPDHGHVTIKAKDIIGIESTSSIMKFVRTPPWNPTAIFLLA
jgi:predicted AlkP superfamily pyrophosphatase or phosphodiesterase